MTTFLVLAAPAFWIGYLVFHYGVDTPWGDQWDLSRLLLVKAAAGTLRFRDFFAFHNEHRHFFPALLIFALGKLTHWNVRAELFVNWLLVCLSGVGLWRLALVSGWRESRARDWLLLAAGILLFTPSQWENLLWGFQIGFFLPLASSIIGLWLARSLPRPLDFVAAMLLCLVSTFSVASGFAAWIFTAPVLFLEKRSAPRRPDQLWWFVWGVVGVASTVLYFHGYKRPEVHPSPALVLQQPVAAFRFFLAYLGNPFCTGTAFARANIAQIAGGALLVPLLGCAAYLFHWRRDRTLLSDALPWLSLTSIALVNAALTTLGRFGFGMNGALQSRYVSFAVTLPIGLLFLLARIVRHRRKAPPLQLAFASFLTALALLFLGAAIYSLDYWRMFQHDRLSGKAALAFINVLDEPQALARHVHWSHWTLKEWTESVARLGYLRPAPLRSRSIREIASDSDEEAMGSLDHVGYTADGQFTASGWAVLLEQHRIADSVLLAYDSGDGDGTIFARADVGYARADVGARLRDDTYQPSGWATSCKREEIPASARRITVWAFNAEECRAFLIGSTSIPASTSE